MLGASLLLFVVVEGALRLVFHFVDKRGARFYTHAIADVYPDSSWVADYFKEDTESAVAQWRSYVYWRLKPYTGTHVNIDQDGIRKTIPSAAPADGVKDIFMFGGSTMWGNGSRDAHTIPSSLASELHARGLKTHVVNFGESGYVNTQEVIALELQLRDGHIPDLVIFYDGVNDTYSAWQQNVAGIPQNEATRVKEFNLSSPSQAKRRTALVLQDVARKLATVRLVNTLLRRNGGQKVATSQIADSNAMTDALSQDVVNTYRANMELVRTMAAHYGFQCLFYWQPNIFEKPERTAYEQGQWEMEKAMEPLFRKTYNLVRTSDLETGGDFHNLSQLFANEAKPVYFDWCHMGEAGNATIARSMVDDVMKALSSTPKVTK